MAKLNNETNGRRTVHVKRARLSVKSLLRDVQRLEERADALLQDLSDELEALPSPDLDKSAGRERAPFHDHSDGLLRLAATHGVNELRMEWLHDGRAFVTIDDRTPFLLPKKLGVLLEILAEDVPDEESRLVGWKTYPIILDRLEARLESGCSRRSFEVAVNRLRDRLEEAGINRYLVQTLRSVGMRFALRRRGAGEAV